ncbi:MAG TPA: hypothetical protein VM287_07700 [Egibacteraceae bacterium]|nr:hypothetical protein [Egibacteraceae bacterium]
MSTPAKSGTPDQAAASRSAEQGRSGQLALIRAVLDQSPEQRLAGLRRASAFFTSAKRV